MSGMLVHGDQVSCSRVGGAMRREATRLRRHAHLLATALADLGSNQGPGRDAQTKALALLTGSGVAAAATSVQVLMATADDLDAAGAALQRYATDLAEGHELGRRAKRRIEEAGLLAEGTRVVEPWGPAGADQAQRRRAQLPEVQSRVDLVTAHVGRARGRLEREMNRLTNGFSAHAHEAHSAGQPPAPPRVTSSGAHRLGP